MRFLLNNMYRTDNDTKFSKEFRELSYLLGRDDSAFIIIDGKLSVDRARQSFGEPEKVFRVVSELDAEALLLTASNAFSSFEIDPGVNNDEIFLVFKSARYIDTSICLGPFRDVKFLGAHIMADNFPLASMRISMSNNIIGPIWQVAAAMPNVGKDGNPIDNFINEFGVIKVINRQLAESGTSGGVLNP